MSNKQAIVLLSGGIDSSLCLKLATDKKRRCIALSFDYGQTHKIELEAARDISAYYGAEHRIILLQPDTFSHSTIIQSAKVENQSFSCTSYVPARNTLFLSYALSLCEMVDAQEIYFGANKDDFNEYVDCRPAYFEAFQNLIQLATKQSVHHHSPQLITPLIEMTKEDIVRLAVTSKLPLELTVSCYQPISRYEPCNGCGACLLKNEALKRISA